MATDFATYDPALVSVVFGPKILTGFAQDSIVTVERLNDTWTDQVGARGYVSRARNADRRGTITVVFDQTSQSNDDLSAIMLQDELNSTGVYPILVRDASGTSVASGASAWLTRPATIEMGNGILGRQWVFRVAVLAMAVGGNS